MEYITAIAYFISCILIGNKITDRFFGNASGLLRIVSSITLGIFCTVFFDYLFAVFLNSTNFPTITSSYCVILIGFVFMLHKVALSKKLKIRFGTVAGLDLLLVVFCLLFSSYIMEKSFRYGTSGDILVGSNEVFDFGHFLSVLRSFSRGDNIPYSSPFIAGTPDMYHFMFYYFAAILERFGIPIVYAVNIPSVIGFSLFLLSVYFLGNTIGRKKIVGILSVLLTITHSSLAFFSYISSHGVSLETLKGIWRLAAYPYNGINDGSIFSIFFTLNVFVNQRHYAFALAVIFVLFLLVSGNNGNNRKESLPFPVIIFLGILSGMFAYWNFMLLPYVGLLLFIAILQKNTLKHALVFIVTMGMVCLLCFIPWFAYFSAIFVPKTTKSVNTIMISYSIPFKNGLLFWIFNLGVLPVASIIGYFKVEKNQYRHTLPLLLTSGLILILGMNINVGVIQKFITPLLVVLNIYAAVFLLSLWNVNWWSKVTTILLFSFITASGVMDFMVIKNDFQYPAIQGEMKQLIDWISKSTPKHSVFLSYGDIFDPVTLAGRKNYWGFYKPSFRITDRSIQTKRMFENPEAEKDKLYKENSISYIVIPKWKKPDFTYVVEVKKFNTLFTLEFENNNHVIYKNNIVK